MLKSSGVVKKIQLALPLFEKNQAKRASFLGIKFDINKNGDILSILN